jgi:hypothetical protein
VRIQLLGLGVLVLVMSGSSGMAAQRPGIPPDGPWSCPDTHPIKGYVSHESGRRVYYLPGSRFYDEASPERCYLTEDEARRDGSRPEIERPPSSPEPRLL